MNLNSLSVYWFVGLRNDGARFFLLFWMIMTLFILISATVGLLCMYLSGSVEMAKVYYSPITIMITLSGFLVVSTPIYYDWIKYVNYFRYANVALVSNEMVPPKEAKSPNLLGRIQANSLHYGQLCPRRSTTFVQITAFRAQLTINFIVLPHNGVDRIEV